MIDINNNAQLLHYIQTEDTAEIEYLFSESRKIRSEHYGIEVYFRGLIEFSNYCKNDCYYCGIRNSNGDLDRYRLTREQILDCCRMGDQSGYRTFVLQSGEDPWYDDEHMIEIVKSIRKEFPDHAITLSIGERSQSSYEALFHAGANRYLLRHETANEDHYRKLHPADMLLKNRKDCLFTLKKIGYQVGAGFMVESPFQTAEFLLEDLRFLQSLQPHMVGIGPFIPQENTPFGKYKQGSLELTLKMIALCRLILPKALIPATTALGTISPLGREKGLMAGANVVMPNLSPVAVRKKYALYDNKICTGDEAAECQVCLTDRIQKIGFTPNMTRGDAIM